jgi:hypothetical protein
LTTEMLIRMSFTPAPIPTAGPVTLSVYRLL